MGGIEEPRASHDDYGDVWTDAIKGAYYSYVHKINRGEYEPRWRGVRVVKLPTDLILYAEVIFKHKPDYIVEAGTRFGGSALFFGDMLMLSGGKKVITIDIKPARNLQPHPFVEYVTDSTTNINYFRRLRASLKDKGSVMVVLDSDHNTDHVAKELEWYSQIVTKEQYLVVEDCWTWRTKPWLPYPAVEEFLKKRDDFRRYHLEKKFVFSITRDGWLFKVK